MAKTTIGYFKDLGNGKTYNIYFRRVDYGYRNSRFEIGNITNGVFFRFGLDNDFIYVYSADCNRSIELCFPKFKDDVKRILEMLFKPRNFEVVELNNKFISRKNLWDMDLINDI